MHSNPLRVSLCASLLLGSSFLSAQSPSAALPPPDRITRPVDTAQLQLLPNHHPLWANPANDLGPASTDLSLTLVLQRSPQQEAALDQLLIDQKNPASPDFHHWLTPVEFGQRFGLSGNDLQSIRTWIESQGLTVQWIAPGGDFVGFSGPATAVGRAFSTTMRNYRVRGEERTSVSSDPLIPAALAPVIKSIRGLYAIADRPASTFTAPQTARPGINSSSGSHYITPADFATIYDRNSVSISGPQQSIGIIGRSRTDFADFSNFRQLTSSSFPNPTEIIPTAFGGVDPGPALTAPPSGNTSIGEQLEATLDVTRAGSVAPTANLLLVVAKITATSGGIDSDTQYLVQTTPVPAQVINISYGDCESDAGASGVTFWDTLFKQAAAEGISVLVSSGDSGASGCEASFIAPVSNPPAISPNYICSSSYATCMGGTEFNDAGNPSAYWSGSNGPGFESALSYIPEGGWNEPTDSQGSPQLASSGGGVSSIIPTPSWQSGPGVPTARTGRYTPDISFSSSCHDAYFACLAASGYGCVVTNGSFTFFGICGTSAAAPSMAGVIALLDEKLGYPVGSINQEIYALAQGQPSTFHDATPATSGVASCSINTPSMCNNSTPGPTGLTGGQAGYALTAGYDLVTGWGSLDIANFLTNFSAGLQAPTVTLTPSHATIQPEQPLSITVTVAGQSGQPTPTGTLSLSWPGNVTPMTATLSSGAATFSIAAGVLPGSTAPTTFTVQYTPDPASAPVYSAATGTCLVTINLITPAISTSFLPAAPTTADNVMVTVTLNGGTGNPSPTGNVQVESVNPPGVTGLLTGGTATVVLLAGTLPPGSDPIGISYTPDNLAAAYYASTNISTSLTVTGVAKTTPTVTATPSPSSVTLANPLTISVQVAGTTAGGPIPTGSGSVVANGQTLQAILYTLSAGKAQILTNPGWLQVGTNSLTVNYSGDANYNPTSTTLSEQVGKAVMSMSITPNPSTVTTAQSLQVIVNLNQAVPGVTPTGTVTLTSGSYTSSPQTLNFPTNIIVPAGALTAGTDTLSVTYSGDSNYAAVTSSTTVVITTPPPTFALTGTAITISAPGATTGNTSTVTVTPANGFTGSVTLTASITTSPAGAQDLPTLSFGATSPVIITGAAAGTATLTVTTTAAGRAALRHASARRPRWLPLGETALAGILLLGFRARRRRWTAMLGSLLLLAALSGAIAACGGGGGGGTTSPPPVTDPGTTPGTYVVDINATSPTFNSSTTVNVVVQ